MRETWTLTLSLCALAAVGLALRAGADDQAGAAPAGAIDQIVWGEHWAGPELDGAKNLEGKVVLLQIWGGCEDCRAVTPGMVRLARRLEGKPFHVIASYCQSGERGAALELLKAKGWSEKMGNLSVMHETRYSEAVPVAHEPYYLLFDHTGKLRYHHAAGSSHGGNGDTYQKQAAELLKEVPKPQVHAAGPEALSDLRAWANVHGKTIEATLLGVNEGRARFQMRNGRTFEYPLEKLSGQSRNEIAELVGK